MPSHPTTITRPDWSGWRYDAADLKLRFHVSQVKSHEIELNRGSTSAAHSHSITRTKGAVSGAPRLVARARAHTGVRRAHMPLASHTHTRALPAPPHRDARTHRSSSGGSTCAHAPTPIRRMHARARARTHTHTHNSRRHACPTTGSQLWQ